MKISQVQIIPLPKSISGTGEKVTIKFAFFQCIVLGIVIWKAIRIAFLKYVAWKLKAARAAGRVCYFDDWSLSEKTDEVGILKNPGFEEGLKGYAHIPGVVIEEGNTVSGSNALHVNVTAASKFYQTVAVKPETKYRWSFWIKASSADIVAYRNYLVAVRKATTTVTNNKIDDYTLLPSELSLSERGTQGSITNVSMPDERTAGSTNNWHIVRSIKAGEWIQYFALREYLTEKVTR